MTSGEKVGAAGAGQAGLRLHAPDRRQELPPPAGVFEPRVEVGHKPARPLDANERLDSETGLGRFFELPGWVEVGGRKPPWPFAGVSVVSLPDVAFDDLLEPVIVQSAPEQLVVGQSQAWGPRLEGADKGRRPCCLDLYLRFGVYLKAEYRLTSLVAPERP